MLNAFIFAVFSKFGKKTSTILFKNVFDVSHILVKSHSAVYDITMLTCLTSCLSLYQMNNI